MNPIQLLDTDQYVHSKQALFAMFTDYKCKADSPFICYMMRSI